MMDTHAPAQVLGPPTPAALCPWCGFKNGHHWTCLNLRPAQTEAQWKKEPKA